ncbi:MAG: glycosyltransferase family 39 protein [Candidatus Taylorbacteria bacterium]|nr:glycosyltransferase family 39 protein [Candidatus Taylorbacteria bacterium]
MNTDKLKRLLADSRRTEVWIFCFALTVKLAASSILFAYNGSALISLGDASGYLELAKSVAAGEGFRAGGMLSAFRTPFYPLFLSLFYFFHLPLAFLPTVQIFLLSCASVLLYRIGSWLFSKPVGFVAAMLFAVEPLLLVYGNMALSESLFVFLLIYSVYSLLKYFSDGTRAPLMLSAILVGAMALTRPIGMYFPLLVLFLMIIKNRLERKSPAAVLRPALIYIGLFVLTIAPWSIRNELTFGSWSLTNHGAIEIYNERVPIVIAAKENIDYNSAFIKNQKNLEKSIPNFSPTLLGNTFAYNDFLARQSFLILKQNIPAVLKFHLIAALSYFHTTGYDYVLRYFGVENATAASNFTNFIFHQQWRALTKALLQTDPINVIRLVGYLLWFIVNVSIAATVIYELRRSRENLFALILLIGAVLYFAVFSIGPHTQARYRIPTYPFLFILIGFATVTIGSRVRIYLKTRQKTTR